MFPACVIQVEPVGQILEKSDPGFIGSQVDPFVLQGTSEPLNEDIVPEAASAVHADPHLPLLQHSGERLAGELPTLVAIEYPRSAISAQRFLEGIHTKSAVKCVGQAPAKYFSAGPVHDGNQVHEPSGHRNVGDIRCPYLVGLVYTQPPEQIRLHRMPRIAFAGAGFGR